MTAKKKQTKKAASKRQAKAPRKPAGATKGAARAEDGKNQKRITNLAHAEATAALIADLEKDAAKKEAAADAKAARKPKAGAAKTAKPSKAPKPPKADKPRRTSLLDAAAVILREAKEPLGARAIVERVSSRGLWKPTKGGKTPHATLYAAMTREIANKGAASRFAKVDRGAFAAGKGA